MKILILLFSFCVPDLISAQNSDFVNFLLDLQTTTTPVHQYMLDVYAETRFKLGVELTELNDEAVYEITESLRAIIEIIDDKDKNFVEIQTPENESCVNETISGWPEAMRLAGSDIQACSDAHVDPIYDRTEELHLFMQDHNYFAYDVQNLVLKTFTDLNLLTEAYKIKETVESRLKKSREDFDRITLTGIERIYLEIRNLRLSVPGEVHACVVEAVAKLRNSATAILEDARTC